MNWVESVRRATVARGVDTWKDFVRKGTAGDLIPEELLYEINAVKAQGEKIWAKDAADIREEAAADRFISKERARINFEIKET